MKRFNRELVGKRLTLKLLEPSFDMAQTIFKTIEESREHLLPWLDWASLEFTKTPEDSFIFLYKAASEWKEGVKFEYGIFLDGKTYLGNIGVFDVDEKKRTAEIGYWLKKSATRKGYMTEAVKLIENEFFKEDGLQRLQICCDVNNIASARVAKKCGYQLEGRLRKITYSPVLKRHRDCFLFSKLKEDWEK